MEYTQTYYLCITDSKNKVISRYPIEKTLTDNHAKEMATHINCEVYANERKIEERKRAIN